MRNPLIAIIALISLTLLPAISRGVSPKDSAMIQQQADLIDFQHQIFEQITGYTKNQQIDTFLKGITQRGLFNGNVLIAQGDDIIYENSFGYAQVGTYKSLDKNSQFQIASTSKTFTGVAATQLIEKGLLHLEDKVADILPGFPYPSITVKHLLSHQSGLQDYMQFSTSYHSSSKGSLTNDGLLQMFINVKPKLIATPGSTFDYCNSNYALVACMVEKLSGLSFPQYLSKNIFIPAGMENTFLLNPDEYGQMANRTLGYSTSWGWVKPDFMDGVFGDKGVYTTTQDLYKYNRALFAGKLLDSEHLDMAYANYSGDSESMYGLGWRMRVERGEKIVYHNGWWHGYRTAFQRRLSDETCIIMLSNRIDKTIYSAAKQILNILDGVDSYMDESVEWEED